MKRFAMALVFVLAVALGVAARGADAPAAGPVLNVTEWTGDEAAAARQQGRAVMITLRGKINHFGMRDYHATVPDVLVRVAGNDQSRALDVRSGDDGWWTLRVLKHKGVPLALSLVYEKQGWITTKSNVLTFGDEDDTDLAIQFVDPDLYNKVIQPDIETFLKAAAPADAPGGAGALRNAVVATVGKSFASMHDDRLPHGDPGAEVTRIPGAVGPVYFNEQVMPDPGYAATSVDGGVAWFNVPPGRYTLTADKAGVEYRDVVFEVGEGDADQGIVLYVASPPDSIQGTNDSPPGND